MTDSPQGLVEPMVPDCDLVICPNCVHQFRAIPVNVQAKLSEAADRIEALERELAAVRELMNVYNLGGWTDAVAPMQRALTAERALEAADAMREEYLGILREDLGPGILSTKATDAYDAARAKVSSK